MVIGSNQMPEKRPGTYQVSGNRAAQLLDESWQITISEVGPKSSQRRGIFNHKQKVLWGGVGVRHHLRPSKSVLMR
jgi:hypothetical protein